MLWNAEKMCQRHSYYNPDADNVDHTHVWTDLQKPAEDSPAPGEFFFCPIGGAQEHTVSSPGGSDAPAPFVKINQSALRKTPAPRSIGDDGWRVVSRGAFLF